MTPSVTLVVTSSIYSRDERTLHGRSPHLFTSRSFIYLFYKTYLDLPQITLPHPFDLRNSRLPVKKGISLIPSIKAFSLDNRIAP